MRRGAQREVAQGVTVIAASPDTPHRERWIWQVSVIEGTNEVPGPPAGATAVTLPLEGPVYYPGLGSAALHVAADANYAIASVARVDLTTPQTLTREVDQVRVLLVDAGQIVVERRHYLDAGDALVVEGDDPLSFTVADARGEGSALAVATLAAPAGRLIGWVP